MFCMFGNQGNLVSLGSFPGLLQKQTPLVESLNLMTKLFFSNAIFPISQNHIYHIKNRDFPGSEHPKEHTMNSVGTCHQEFYRMLCTSLDSSVPRGTDAKFTLLLASVTSFALKKFKPGTSIYSHTCGLLIKIRAV